MIPTFAAVPLVILVPTPSGPQDVPFLEVHSEGLETLLPAAKDAGLRRALQLVGARLVELPGQVDADVPLVLLDLGARAALGPMHLRALARDGQPPFSVQVEARLADEGAAMAYVRELAVAFEEFGGDLVQESPRLWRLDERPPGWIGVRGDEALFAFGALAEPPTGAVDPPLPEGVRAALSARLDVERFLALAPGVARDLPALLAVLGGVDFACGADAERGHAVLRIEGGAAFVPSATGLDALRLVPPDATWASVGVSNFALLASLLADTNGAEFMTGLLARVDDYLGDVQGSYAAVRTGGGGFLSTVVFAEAESPERLEELWTSLPGWIDALVAEQTNGMVAVRRREESGAPLLVLTFPGLPVPFEPTLTHDGATLFLGLTPQAALAARAHALARGPGLGQHAGFRSQLPASLDGVVSLTFVDTPALLGTGYGPACLVGSLLANAVRSPVDASRDAGLVLPSFADLSADARPIVLVTRVVGDDLVVEARLDRSLAVNFAGIAGAVVSDPAWIVLGGSLATLVAPRVARATDYARRARAIADLRALEDAVEMYTMRNNGNHPSSLEELVTPDEFGNTYLGRTSVPLDPWGNEYLYDPPRARARARVYTFGADGIPGGAGEAADLSTDELR